MVTKGVWRLITILLAAGMNPLLACKYNVRDVGFVALESAPYRLLFFTDASTSTNLVDEFSRATVVNYLDANVVFETVRTDEPLEESFSALMHRHRLTAFPAVLLVAPDGRGLRLTLPPAADREAIRRLVKSTISSPLIDRLRQLLPVAFAAILVNEGADGSDSGNQRALAAARNAVSRFGLVMDRLPKPVKEPPVVIGLDAQSRSAERVSRWSLELSESKPHEPEAVVVYGRCRRVGPPLRGSDLTEEGLLRVLTILGQDCECDLDRSWMRGPLMPVAWEEEMQRLVVQNLGFDAENPLVRMEVSRILSRGPNPTARRVGLDATGGFSALGYTEVSIDDLVAEERANEAAEPGPQVRFAPTEMKPDTTAPAPVAEPPTEADPEPEPENSDNEVVVLTNALPTGGEPVAEAPTRLPLVSLVLAGLVLGGGLLIVLLRKPD